MLTKWLKKIINECISEQITLALVHIHNRLDAIGDDISGLDMVLTHARIDSLIDNIGRLNQMTNELKGVVAMSRASLVASKKKETKKKQ